MGKILCATRGGADSERTQQAAIALAKERGDELTFLYVADSSFLDNTAAPVVVDVERELDQMGRFQLSLARQQAVEQGVDAQVAMSHGHLQVQLVLAARQLGATTIVLGRPQGRTAIFDEADLESFAHELGANTGAEVLIV
jgi:nucleotide-binding universal stress UspA family protein